MVTLTKRGDKMKKRKDFLEGSQVPKDREWYKSWRVSPNRYKEEIIGHPWPQKEFGPYESLVKRIEKRMFGNAETKLTRDYKNGELEQITLYPNRIPVDLSIIYNIPTEELKIWVSKNNSEKARRLERILEKVDRFNSKIEKNFDKSEVFDGYIYGIKQKEIM